MKSVRTYLNFSDVIDPASISTMPDLELSAALATPLAVFNEERQVVSGLAEKWAFPSSHQLAFTLRQGLSWSDGSAIKASEYKSALDRAKRLYGGDLKALFDAVEKIEATDERTLVFTTKDEASKSGLLLKLTEPMYGLVAVKDGSLDLSKSAGPYVVQKNAPRDELLLIVNKHWYSYTQEMPERVEIKRPHGSVGTIGAFENDPWPNLISGSSLMTTATAEEIKHSGFKTWQRTLDKTFALFASQRFLESGGAEFIKTFAAHVDRASLMKGLSGFTSAEQFFPRGYILSSDVAPEVTPGKWQKKDTIRVAMMESPLLIPLREQLPIAAKKIGSNLKIDTFPLPKLDEIAKRGEYDLLAISFAVADPNFEGAMSFFIEREPAFIKSTTGAEDFSAQMREARKLPSSNERAAAMRKIIFKAQETGHFLPLFHFSSFAVAKPGVDLSGIPNSDETILFSKLRMR